MTNSKNRKAKDKQRKNNAVSLIPPKDVVTGWTYCRINYGGETHKAVAHFAYEVPIGLMNFQTDLPVKNWASVVRYKFSKLVARLELPQSYGGEMFLGWNRTPSTLTQLAVLTHNGYHDYQRRCDIIKIGSRGDQTSLTLNLKTGGWKTYMSVATYGHYTDLFNQQLERYSYGSLVFGFTVGEGKSNPDMTGEMIANLLQISCVQSTQSSKVT